MEPIAPSGRQGGLTVCNRGFILCTIIADDRMSGMALDVIDTHNLD